MKPPPIYARLYRDNKISGSTKMKKQLSNEQIDSLMRTMVSDASLDDTAINDIADSPTLWWSVQREISVQKEVRSPWPPALRRWLMIGVPTFAALALMAIFVFRPSGEAAEQAGVQQNVTTAEVRTPLPSVTEPALPATESKRTDVTVAKIVRRTERPSVTTAVAVPKKGNSNLVTNVVEKKSEIKSDFIALSYARNPESGQIVRVKVPSSMMVTLGLVSSVEKPTNLIDAEVVVGDDGLTQAIRFIH